MKEIRLADFRAENLIFSINHQFKPSDKQVPLALRVNQRVRMSAKPEEPVFLNMALTVFGDAEKNNYPFTVVADVTGVFFVNAEGQDREAILKDHGLEILMPYMRAMVSQLVSLANLPTPVILPPLDADAFHSEPTAEPEADGESAEAEEPKE
ncbi:MULTISPECIES: protein-export chaperone SecB [Jonquetella]|uniref:Preprotein translocase subunit SecB n=1 Tax=Jonquetella anthropi DSM 22815 TaxID=885272 RepID=H0UMH4_9BACT|nr:MULTISPECIES: protein-export chaperone SecB [Jonquetella]EEX48236.1 hypothetical protein GCWU000246_01557 [Jonquetella anthropi E3_33 E1]EHM13677.1 preprotein translocase subunit SecB [Jonquetella anthropi DSM 22815]ERL24524.1 preprotein translocase, SecB subunit [Jonquetella sp. BV3C21]